MHTEVTLTDARAYYTAPDDTAKYPGLIVIEEIWGLNDHIRDIADRFAREGFVVLAPELLPHAMLSKMSPDMPEKLFNPETRAAIQPILREALQPLSQPEYAQTALTSLSVCVDHLLADPRVNGTIAVTGFCFGGSYSFHLAAHDARIRAAVPFYGQPPREEEIPHIMCPILAFYGDLDEGIMATLPTLKERMQHHGKTFEAIVYPNAKHAFMNDTNPHTYHAEYAQDAWRRAVTFLKTHTSTNDLSTFDE